MKKVKGSLTIEAVISFTIFFSFMFMLLTTVKMALTVMVLDNITSETAKSIACAAYPLALFNDMADDNGTKVTSYETTAKLSNDMFKNTANGLFSYITSATEDDQKKAKEQLSVAAIRPILQYGKGKLGEIIFTKAEELIGQAGNELVGSMIRSSIEDYNANINLDNLELTVCKLPVPKSTYEEGCNSEGYTQMGISKSDFNKDDVVIGLSYDYKMALPFLPTINIKLKSVAIEHGWVNGGTSTSDADGEGIKLKDLLVGKHYYITGTGKKYHKANCITLWRGGATAVSVNELKDGYEPCKVCKPPKLK